MNITQPLARNRGCRTPWSVVGAAASLAGCRRFLYNAGIHNCGPWGVKGDNLVLVDTKIGTGPRQSHVQRTNLLMDHRIAVIGVLAAILAASAPVGAAVVVVENRTAEQVAFGIRQSGGPTDRHRLSAGALEPIAVAGPVEISFDAGGQPHRYRLRPNSAHYFAARGDRLDLFARLLPAAAPSPRQGSGQIAPRPARTSDPSDIIRIPVKLLADDAVPTVRTVWEKRLRGRLAAASEIFERYCRVRFDVVAVGMWKSDEDAGDFAASVAEFETQGESRAGPPGDRLYRPVSVPAGRTPRRRHARPVQSAHLDSRGAVRVSEPERLEVLVHELGHYLGAAHSAETTSVMRPLLGDRQAVARRFHIGFDALNTLAMYVIAEDYRRAPLSRLWQLPAETKRVLRPTYAALARELPDDPAAPKFRMLLDARIPPPPDGLDH